MTTMASYSTFFSGVQLKNSLKNQAYATILMWSRSEDYTKDLISQVHMFLYT